MKSLAALLFGLVLSLILVESLSQLYYYTQHKTPYSAKRILGALGASEVAPENGSKLPELYTDQREIVHPYTGYIRDYNPAFRRNYGYDTDNAPVQKRGKDHVLVGLFGGSVAMHLHHALDKALAKALADAGDTRQLKLVNFALGGYKQPQQLNTLTYFLAMGAEFDLVINLDGFNELTLPYADNLPEGVSPYFPRLWHQRVPEALDAQRLRAYAAIAGAQEQLGSIVAGLRLPVLSRSAAWGLLSTWRAGRAQQRVKEQMATLSQKTEMPYVQSGPPYPKDTGMDAFMADMAAFWGRCSRLMGAACQASGCAYVHVLQPNQYVAGMKTMSREELATAYEPDAPYSTAARQGYPALLAEGGRLAAEGVSFVDATPLFKDHPETLYLDACCHLNSAGNELLATYVAERVLPALHPQPAKK